MSSFGIGVLDNRLDGPVDGGLHVAIGGPGTGKSVLALQFLMEGVERGGRVALLTQARPEDVLALAESMGLDLRPYLQDGRWVLLGYQQGFRERYRRSIEPVEVFEELSRFVTDGTAPDRLAIDTCGPLIEERETGNGAELLVELLGQLGSTTLLTCSAEFPGPMHSGFDLVSQRAALILQLTMGAAGWREMVVRKSTVPLEVAGPISFEIEAGRGIAPPSRMRRKRRSDVAPEVQRRVLLMDVPGDMPEELQLWFEESFELAYFTDPVDAFPELAHRDFGVVVVHVDRRTLDRGLHVMRQLRRAAGRPPILIVCPVDVRSSDRVQALRAGADDFVSGGLHPDELASRIEALLRRGRTEVDEEGAEESATAEQLATADAPGSDDVREIVHLHLQGPKPPVFSLVILRPKNGRGVQELANHVTERMRQDTGDVVNVRDDRVEVYLHGALASHADRFLKRVLVDPFVKVGVDVFTAPTDRSRLLEVVGQHDG